MLTSYVLQYKFIGFNLPLAENWLVALRWQKMISPSNWPYSKNHCIWTTIHASVVSFNRQNYFWGLYLQKITFLSNFEQKILHPPGWPIVGVAYRRSGPSAAKMQLKRRIRHCPQTLPGGLWVMRLITHAFCSLAYSDIAWRKLFLIFTMTCLFGVFFAYKTPYSVLIDNSIHIQEIDTEKTWLTLQGQIFRCIKHLSVSHLKYLYIVSVKYFR